ncbi:MFS transporter [Lysinibacillus sp. NPDC093688]|uniref:MFS transporter n=1 Tax=Lysinibacillus sp. NPDC093688 TaxID=3390577 RepID=UPI003CFD6664
MLLKALGLGNKKLSKKVKRNIMKTIVNYFHPMVWVILIGTMITRIASFMMIPFLALYLLNHFNLSPVWIGVALGIAPLFATVGALLGGYINDRFNRKYIIIITCIIWAAVFLGFTFAPSVIFFTVLNALNGLCRAFFEPGTQALMMDYVDESRKKRLFSIRYTLINIAAVIGPLVGVLLAKLADARATFVIASIVFFIFAMFLLYFFKKYPTKQQFLSKDVKVTQIFSTFVQDKKLFYFILGSIIIFIGYSQYDSTLPQLIDLKVSNGVELFSYLIVVNSVTVLILQLPISLLIEKLPNIYSLIIGVSAFTIGLYLLGSSKTYWMFCFSMVIFAIGEVFCFPIMSIVIEEIAPNNQKSIYFGASQLRSLGSFIGPVLGGGLLGQTTANAYTILCLLMLTSIFIYYKGLKNI